VSSIGNLVKNRSPAYIDHMNAQQSSLPTNASPDLAHLHAAIEKAPAPADIVAAGGQPLRLVCTDGAVLAAHWYLPTQGLPRAVAVVSAATGVPQGFYRAFAQWLAQRGYAVLTYDYRGIGLSRRSPVTNEPASMHDWGRLDMSAALAQADAKRHAASGQRLPLLLIGHSFGGNALGLAQGVEQADAVLTVASQLGDWRLWPGVHRLVTWLFFHIMLPTVGHVMGHAPGWVLGGGSAQPLPKQVALQWARWGRTRGFLYGDASLKNDLGLHHFTGAAHLWNVSDDLTYGPSAAVDGLGAVFSNARVTRHTLTPAHAGVQRLGHFGAFRREVGPRVWPRLLAPIEAASPALTSAINGPG
jgi:predicted alpha/beta hydrolase